MENNNDPFLGSTLTLGLDIVGVLLVGVVEVRFGGVEAGVDELEDEGLALGVGHRAAERRLDVFHVELLEARERAVHAHDVQDVQDLVAVLAQDAQTLQHQHLEVVEDVTLVTIQNVDVFLR